jgi:hypothetical protein
MKPGSCVSPVPLSLTTVTKQRHPERDVPKSATPHQPLCPRNVSPTVTPEVQRHLSPLYPMLFAAYYLPFRHLCLFVDPGEVHKVA